MSVRSQAETRAFSPDRLNQAPVERPGVKAILEQLAHKAAGIHGHADALREHCFGPRPEPSAPERTTASNPDMMEFLEEINRRLQGIDDALEFLTARL